MANERANVVLVHGGFVDGSGWLGVYDGLRRQGYQVTVVQNPTKPSWYLVATEDRMIPPDAQRAMSKRAGSEITEVAGSHAVYVSQPAAVAALIAKAANAVLATG